MSEANHTAAPSPWHQIEAAGCPDLIFCGDDHGYVCNVNTARPDWRASARLVAAAPALLAAARLALGQMEGWVADQEWAEESIERLRGAVEAAEGK